MGDAGEGGSLPRALRRGASRLGIRTTPLELGIGTDDTNENVSSGVEMDSWTPDMNCRTEPVLNNRLDHAPREEFDADNEDAGAKIGAAEVVEGRRGHPGESTADRVSSGEGKLK